MDLSIIIVNYNTKELTLQTLRSIYAGNNKFLYEVILVDNASKDDSVEVFKKEFPQVKLIENNQNLGFSKANNIGIKMAGGRYILLLNSDTLVIEDTLEIMIKFMDTHLDVGAAGCKVELPDGSLDKACKRSFPTPQNALYHALKLDHIFPHHKKFGEYNLTFLDENQTHEVDCLVGAFMLIRREVIEQVGLLDEDFFMYGEDIDWCYRIKQVGWKIVYYPKTKIIHYKGGSSKKKNPKLIYEFYRAMYLFYHKHYRYKYPWSVKCITYTGIGVMLAIKLLFNWFKGFRRHEK
ncbi:glycosyltransferase family 2 protein [Thermotalea metallivorans]|uniref:N-acetylglucosaminyl-diphospho-decaprenol L-rhamnosyltransferase n=1 Tax=Thermotalea metallivorans TaxID=520762 RepID=A0A140L6W6_9FIRM|nr:glycosyltransferase family 2 protein [Thermotalea metallivorans]KXG76291.1 N-acetylglucosaminyl-diphospho-decaprenol L-rhamnosyltransferase [Thermotalea metallivorans]